MRGSGSMDRGPFSRGRTSGALGQQFGPLPAPGRAARHGGRGDLGHRGGPPPAPDFGLRLGRDGGPRGASPPRSMVSAQGLVRRRGLDDPPASAPVPETGRPSTRRMTSPGAQARPAAAGLAATDVVDDHPRRACSSRCARRAVDRPDRGRREVGAADPVPARARSARDGGRAPPPRGIAKPNPSDAPRRGRDPPWLMADDLPPRR